MSKSNRNAPKRARVSESRYTFFEFDREFPDDATCLDWLISRLYPDGIFCPKCERVTKHHRVKARTSYSCQFCGHHVHPMKGTIFEDSATSLRLWFHAIFLMSQTRCGISAKQLERELGVTYKTAWRMFHKIRSMLSPDDDPPLGGRVEMDETYVGGRRKGRTGRPGTGDPQMTAVFGMAQRPDNGDPARIVVKKVENVRAASLMPHVQTRVLPESIVYTDELHSYKRLGKMGYEHSRVRHSEKVYVIGDCHVNTVEGFWSLLKGGLRGVYHSVSSKHLQAYLDEYAFRFNNRDAGGRGMFGAFLDRIVPAMPSVLPLA